MHIRTHAQVSLLAGLLLYPYSPRHILLLAAGGVLVDLDHFLLYALRSGDWSIIGALVYDRYRHYRPEPGDTRPRYGKMRSWLHDPLMLPISLLLARQWPALRPLALGLFLHLCLDHVDLLQRLALRWKYRGRCACCGTRRHVTVRNMLRAPTAADSRPAAPVRLLLCRQCAHRLFWQASAPLSSG
jgi:hypothetical protein